MPKPFYITTAIDYTNGPPHIGHAYEKVLADVIARYHRLKGEEVFFLTGVDQHGQKVQQSAEKAGVSPQQFVDEITVKFRALWEKLEISYNRPDGWAATTDPLHKRCVQGILQRLYDEGQIYKDKQKGYYSVRQEQFLTDKERGPDGEFGPEWGEVEHRTEENYYFRLEKHKEWLRDYLKAHPDCVAPDFRHTELINAVEKLNGDLCISRPKSRLSWGIELPFDVGYVNYVWFDALTNYISFAGYDSSKKEWEEQPNEFRNRWPALHVIGKDILIPAHGIYWPIMLHALGFPDGSKEGEIDRMPKFLVHGWWNISGAKMSKSLGNVIDPNDLANKYGAEALRYYLMSDIGSGSDADFSEVRLVSRYNSDLANSIGNLLNRTLSMVGKFQNKSVVRTPAILVEDPARELCQKAEIDIRSYNSEFSFGRSLPLTSPATLGLYAISGAITDILRIAQRANASIDAYPPWKLAKSATVGAAGKLGAVLYGLSESLRIIAILISPVLPKAAHGIFDQLNWKMEPELAGKEARFSLGEAEWGKMPDGHLVGKPTPLFPRIEVS
ncbi:MAG TPA: methionine--tRNA ligase [Chthoniobacterales bacterium]|jgi:methionyl-tRNA synthetase